jgi:phenylpropionate dioxygenase-like ring-hydroxylating dioxygenase large terminal subunit
MLSAADNELMCRIGEGTPMGNLMREYWIPFLFSWEIESDGPPQRVRLLGEDLLAFRASSGKPGLIGENCPHRGASLYFGRNENGGLACIYHGWRFDVNGACIDMPSEPESSNFHDKVHAVSYPLVEKARFIWTYMGAKDVPPPLPALEWLDLPEDQIVANKRVQYTNWVQGMEGDLDQSHLSFTHRWLKPNPDSIRSGVDVIRTNDTHPHFEVTKTEYGTLVACSRESGDGRKYWRLTQHMMPFHTITPPYGDDPTRNWRAWVPIDDENVAVIGVTFHPTKAFTGEQREAMLANAGVWTMSPEHRAPPTSAWFGSFRPALTVENDFHQDRELQKTGIYSGIAEFWAQDAAPQLTMGRIFNRTKEHLGTSDSGIITVRRRLTGATKKFAQDGETPYEVTHPDVYQIRADALFLEPAEPWYASTAKRRRVSLTANPDSPQ